MLYLFIPSCSSSWFLKHILIIEAHLPIDHRQTFADADFVLSTISSSSSSSSPPSLNAITACYLSYNVISLLLYHRRLRHYHYHYVIAEQLLWSSDWISDKVRILDSRLMDDGDYGENVCVKERERERERETDRQTDRDSEWVWTQAGWQWRRETTQTMKSIWDVVWWWSPVVCHQGFRGGVACLCHFVSYTNAVFLWKKVTPWLIRYFHGSQCTLKVSQAKTQSSECVTLCCEMPIVAYQAAIRSNLFWCEMSRSNKYLRSSLLTMLVYALCMLDTHSLRSVWPISIAMLVCSQWWGSPRWWLRHAQ